MGGHMNSTSQPSGPGAPARSRVAAIFRTLFSAIGEYLTRSVSLFWIGPLVVALVVVPEFLQHVAEIHLGMFDSLERGRAVADDPLRMGFGYAKLTGLALTFIASARFWWCRTHGGRWYDVRQIAWGRLILGFFLFMAIGSIGELFPLLANREAPVAFSVAFSLLSLPFLFVLLAGLFGDRATPLKTLFAASWPWVILLALLVPLGFGPLAWLHSQNHHWAMGAHDAIVWALMIFDSLVVGLIASSVGAGLFVAYDRFFQSRTTA